MAAYLLCAVLPFELRGPMFRPLDPEITVCPQCANRTSRLGVFVVARCQAISEIDCD